jgi:hypothetical protein
MDKKRRVTGKGNYNSVGENQRETERQFNNNLHISKEIRNAYAHSVSAIVIHLPSPIKKGDRIPPAILKEGKGYKFLGMDRNENTVHYSSESTKESLDRQSINRDYLIHQVNDAAEKNQETVAFILPLPIILGDVIFHFASLKDKTVKEAYKLAKFNYEKRSLEYKKCLKSEMDAAAKSLLMISAGMQEIKKTSDPEIDPETSEEKQKAAEHDRIRQKENAEYITQYCINAYTRHLFRIDISLPRLINKEIDRFPKFLNLARTGYSYEFVSVNYEKNELTYKLAPTDLSKQKSLPHAPHFGDDEIGKRFGGVN